VVGRSCMPGRSKHEMSRMGRHPRTIPQRELRNNVTEVLRDAEGGTEFTITVRGRPVTRLGPVDRSRERRRDVDRETRDPRGHAC
jgi:prevent-host-death family protein